MGAERPEDRQITFRQAIPTMLWLLGVIAVGVFVQSVVLGRQPKKPVTGPYGTDIKVEKVIPAEPPR